MKEGKENKKEIEKDLKALDEYLKSDSHKNADFTKFAKAFCENANKFSIDYYDNIKNDSELRTPARIRNKGVIEIDKKHFMPNEGSVDYHKMKLRHVIITHHELLHIGHHLKHGINITKNKLLEWIKYADDELKQFRASQEALLKSGDLLEKDRDFGASIYMFKKYLFKKYWWKLGIYGIKQRIKYAYMDYKFKKIIKR